MNDEKKKSLTMRDMDDILTEIQIQNNIKKRQDEIKIWHVLYWASLVIAVIIAITNLVGGYIWEETIKSTHPEIFSELQNIKPIDSTEECKSDKFEEYCEEGNIYSDSDQYLIDRSNELLRPVEKTKNTLWIVVVVFVAFGVFANTKYTRMKK